MRLTVILTLLLAITPAANAANSPALMTISFMCCEREFIDKTSVCTVHAATPMAIA